MAEHDARGLLFVWCSLFMQLSLSAAGFGTIISATRVVATGTNKENGIKSYEQQTARRGGQLKWGTLAGATRKSAQQASAGIKQERAHVSQPTTVTEDSSHPLSGYPHAEAESINLRPARIQRRLHQRGKWIEGQGEVHGMQSEWHRKASQSDANSQQTNVSANATVPSQGQVQTQADQLQAQPQPENQGESRARNQGMVQQPNGPREYEPQLHVDLPPTKFDRYLQRFDDFKYDLLIVSGSRRKHGLFLASTLMYLLISGAMKQAATVHLVLGNPELMHRSLIHNLKHFPQVTIHNIMNETEVEMWKDDSFTMVVETWRRAMRVPDADGPSDRPLLFFEDDVMLVPDFGMKLYLAAKDAWSQAKGTKRDIMITPYTFTQMMPDVDPQTWQRDPVPWDLPDVPRAVTYTFHCCVQSIFMSSGHLRRAFADAMDRWPPLCGPGMSRCGFHDITLRYLLQDNEATVGSYKTHPALVQHMGALSAAFARRESQRYHRTSTFPWHEKVYTQDPEGAV